MQGHRSIRIVQRIQIDRIAVDHITRVIIPALVILAAEEREVVDLRKIQTRQREGTEITREQHILLQKYRIRITTRVITGHIAQRIRPGKFTRLYHTQAREGPRAVDKITPARSRTTRAI